MMSLPFLLFACGLGAAWLRQRGAAMGFWVAGLVTFIRGVPSMPPSATLVNVSPILPSLPPYKKPG